LLHCGAPVCIESEKTLPGDAECVTPLYLAAISGHFQIVKFLLEKYYTSPCLLISPFVIIGVIQEGHATILELLLDHNIKIRLEKEKQVSTLKTLLLTFTSRQSHKPHHTEGALWWAAIKGNKEVMRVILEKEGYPNQVEDREKERKVESVDRTEDGTTPLHCAAIYGNPAVIKMMIEKGAKVNETTSDGTTALHFAAERGNREVVRVLVVCGGADLNRKDNKGETALKYAKMNGHKPTARLLRSLEQQKIL